MFFEQERLPYELGWKKPLVQTNFLTLAVMVAQIVLWANDELNQGLVITESELRRSALTMLSLWLMLAVIGTLKAAFNAVAALTGQT
jgi:hypothetical protein